MLGATMMPSNNSAVLSNSTQIIPSPTGFSACVLRKMGSFDLAIVEGEKGVKLSGGSPLISAALAGTLAFANKRGKRFRSSMS